MRKLSHFYLHYIQITAEANIHATTSKYSDDTALLSLLTRNSDTAVYKSELAGVFKWCEEHSLLLNVKKTK